MSNEPIKVSDWSQPIKIGIFLAFFAGTGVFVLWLIGQINEGMELLRQSVELLQKAVN